MNLSYEFNRITNLLNNNKFENVIKVCEKLIKKKLKIQKYIIFMV